jgi:hypothetical protein
MSFFSKLIGDGAARPVEAIGKIIDDLHTSKEEQLEAEQVLVNVQAKLQGLQAEITKQEASHRSVFVAGWRPGLMWLCIAILGFNYLVAPVALSFGHIVPQIADPDHIFNLVIAAMGMASLRTIEKRNGITR